MKKLSRVALTAITAVMAVGVFPTAAFAAVNTYNIPGGKVVVVGSLNGNDCVTNLPGITIPGITIPGGSSPGIEFPDIEIPGIEIPGNGDSGSGNPENGNPVPDQPETDVEMSAFAEEVVKLVNEERAKAGLAPLTVNAAATSAAQTRAMEIQTSFSHTRPDGRSFTTALTEAGASFMGAGENIAYGQSSPEQVMNGWMNSSGHRANILNSSYTSIGVGYYRSASGVNYWTQLFMR